MKEVIREFLFHIYDILPVDSLKFQQLGFVLNQHQLVNLPNDENTTIINSFDYNVTKW